MIKIYLLFFFALLTFSKSYSQSISICFGGGVVPQTNFQAYTVKTPSSFSGIIKIGYSIKSTNLGLRFDAYRINGKSKNTAVFPSVYIGQSAKNFEFGINAGLVIDAPINSSEYTSKTDGFFGGLQFSYTQYFSKHFGAFANLSPRMIFLKEKHWMAGVNSNPKIFSVPINIGISFKL